jgi:hypothetical protein
MRHPLGASPRPAVFGMDGTILECRVIYAVARELRITGELKKILRSTTIHYLGSRKVARSQFR